MFLESLLSKFRKFVYSVFKITNKRKVAFAGPTRQGKTSSMLIPKLDLGRFVGCLVE